MRVSCRVVLISLLFCSLTSLSGAEENSAGHETKTPSLLPLSPLTVPAVSQKSLLAPSVQPSTRLGHVDITRIAAESEMAKAEQDKIGALKKKLQGQIEAKRKQLEKQQAAIEAKLKTFTSAQREAKAKDFQKKVEEFQKFGMNAEKDLQARQEEFSVKLFKAIEQASAELAKAKGLALVIIKRELLYLDIGVDAQDVTEGVIATIDGKVLKEKKP